MKRIPVNRHTTLVMDGKRPVRVENDGLGRDPVEDAEQWLGHPLEYSEPEKDEGTWIFRVWLHEDCDCASCIELKKTT